MNFSILYDKINERAFSTYNEKIEKENYYLWQAHWILTIDVLKKEYEQEALFATVKSLDEIRNEQLNLMDTKTRYYVEQYINQSGS
jgi:hypothetical protein